MYFLRFIFFCLLLGGLLSACAPRVAVPGRGMHHAVLLHIEDGDHYSLVQVQDPWHEGEVLRSYVLAERGAGAQLPDSVAQLHPVRLEVPLRHAAVLSSVHAALLYELGAGARVGGLADAYFVVSDTLRRDLSRGRLRNLGSSMQPDCEQLVAMQADAVLVSPYEGAAFGSGTLPRDIPIVLCADYMETSPLGRAEWMRFYGRLVGCGARADSLFAAVESAYTALKQRAEAVGERPTLFCDYMQGASWPLPGGDSYLAGLFADAGADYLFADRPGAGSIFLSFEEVLASASQADIWLMKYGRAQDPDRASLLREQPYYNRFKAWRSGRLYACNTVRVPYYEEVPFHPERLLRELISLCHPGLLPACELRYYHPMP